MPFGIGNINKIIKENKPPKNSNLFIFFVGKGVSLKYKVMKVTNGARPYKPLPNYLEEGNYEFRSKTKAAQRGAKRNKHLEAKEKLLKQDFEYCNEIAFIMEIREQKIINTKTLLSKRIYKRCDFSGNVVEDEEIEEAVISILDLVRDLKDFLDLPIYSKDFVKIAFVLHDLTVKLNIYKKHSFALFP